MAVRGWNSNCPLDCSNARFKAMFQFVFARTKDVRAFGLELIRCLSISFPVVLDRRLPRRPICSEHLVALRAAIRETTGQLGPRGDSASPVHRRGPGQPIPANQSSFGRGHATQPWPLAGARMHRWTCRGAGAFARPLPWSNVFAIETGYDGGELDQCCVHSFSPAARNSSWALSQSILGNANLT